MSQFHGYKQGNNTTNPKKKINFNQGGCKLTNIIPMSIDVDPIIKALSLHLIHAQTPEQVPVISPPKMVPINSTAPEQSYATSASTPVD